MLIVEGVNGLILDVRSLLGMSEDYPLMCSLVFFLVNWLSTLSPWICVSVSIERALAVWVPHKIQLISNIKTILAYLSLTSIAMASLHVEIFTRKMLERDSCIAG